MKVPGSPSVLYGALFLALALGLLCWWKFASDPRSAFLSEVDNMIAMANRGEHLALRKKLSPDAENVITNSFMSVPQALFTARKLDMDRNIRYRLAQLSVFYPGDYAEIDVERSSPGGDFSNSRRFPVPFIYQKGEWRVAGGFRGERDFNNPFE
jgi:hypothetical protein